MACRQFGTKSLSKPTLCYCQLEPWEQTSVNFLIKIQKIIHDNASENVCEKAAILFRGDELNYFPCRNSIQHTLMAWLGWIASPDSVEYTYTSMLDKSCKYTAL